MIRSMTGYGQGFAAQDGISFDIEFKSVNSRYFDLNIRMPKSLIVLEDRVRKAMNSRISRGKIDLFVTYRNTCADRRTLTVDENLAGKYIESLKAISDTYGLSGGVSLELLSKMDGIITIDEKKENPDELFSIFMEALSDAMDAHERMRTEEGENLKADILKKRKAIGHFLRNIEKAAPEMVPEYRERLMERLREIRDLNIDEERAAVEIALFTDRSSIDEEITRMQSHLDQLLQILESEGPHGKRLDFLLQEMNREANTMASKSCSTEVTDNALSIKNEIEKIREQIQNIE